MISNSECSSYCQSIVQLLVATANEVLECKLGSVVSVIITGGEKDITASFSQVKLIEFFAVRRRPIATSHM